MIIAGSWVEEMNEYVKAKEEQVKDMYFFYPLCPKCAKHYGEDYAIAFAKV